MERGHCTGPLRWGVDAGDVDELGRVFVSTHVLLGGTAAAGHVDGGMDDPTEWKTCPVGAMRASAPLVLMYRRHASGLRPIGDVYRRPSAAAYEVIETLADAENAAQIASMEADRERARRDARAQAAARARHGR